MCSLKMNWVSPQFSHSTVSPNNKLTRAPHPTCPVKGSLPLPLTPYWRNPTDNGQTYCPRAISTFRKADNCLFEQESQHYFGSKNKSGRKTYTIVINKSQPNNIK
jgi:hypothetical protein